MCRDGQKEPAYNAVPMVNISGIGQAQSASGTTRRAGSGSTAFSVAGQGSSVGGPAAAASVAGLDGLLQLQEFEDATTRDRQAKRQGHALLQALGDLQRLLLGGPSEGAALDGALHRLATLVETCPEASDPALAGLVGGILLRARVELARRGR